MRFTAVLLVAFVCLGAFANEPVKRTLTFEDRVRAQEAIEGVYWKHRLWPESNAAPKPSLDAVLSENVLRARAEEGLKKSAALEQFWSYPLRAEDLQAELNRMSRDTKAPEVLRELFAALGNDPRLVAETLARPALADRLLRRWYAREDRFHGAVRATAERDLKKLEAGTDLAKLGRGYTEVEWVLDQTQGASPASDKPGDRFRAVKLTPEAWEGMTRWLAHTLGQPEASDEAANITALPTNVVSGLREEDERFVVATVLSKSSDRIRVGIMEWRKTTFESWWLKTAPALSTSGQTYDSSLLSVPQSVAEDCEYDSWTRLPSVPEPRFNHSAVWTGAEMIVWGGAADLGANGGFYVQSGGRYDPATDTWRPTSLVDAPESRYYHTAVWTGTEMIVWGGNANGFFLRTGGRYNPVTETWTATSTGTNAPAERYLHTAVWTGSEMIVWGGFNGNALNTGGRYDPATDSWMPTSTAANLPGGRYLHTAIWTGAEMIVWGGYNNGSHFDTGARYDPSTDSWTPTSSAGLPARREHTAVWTGKEMIVWGGLAGGYTNTGGRYNVATDTWTATSMGANVPVGRYRHTAVWTGTEMIVWGGLRPSYLNTGARYNPLSDTWLPARTTGAPSGRDSHTMIWTGSEIVVWGGYPYTNTGGRYRPAADTWVPTSTDAPPPARELHSSVWTGSELIVWGGFDGSQYRSDGSRYNLALDQWSPTNFVDAPSTRMNHTAVWSGSDMIIWGGEDSSGRLNTGAWYSPALDTWTPTPTPGAPSARSLHSAVWAGNRMIVWGGNGDADVRTGGYLLGTTWTQTSIVGAPSARSNHTAIWTGTQMIVWGGDPSTRTGGRYSPGADTWTATNTAQAPDGRLYHSAVWTGTDMVVWGGASAANLNSGGRYTPATDSWVPTATVGAPSPRSHQRAVWTGQLMLVWGGYSGTQYVDTGGRYQYDTNTWAPMATSQWASARARHTAVWDGNEMIVWGGYGPLYVGGLGYLNDGVRYCPCAPADDNCNAVDDNCNGQVDEGFGTTNTSCGIGACARTGTRYCANATVIDTCVPGQPAASDTACNGIDDDCDGSIDEDFLPESTSCGIGACAATGMTSCIAAVVGDSCAPGTPAPDDASCNGIDDDCDGSTDEEYVPVATTCGIGACASTGTKTCSTGAEIDSCTPGAPASSDTSCNGIDENCNGAADEGYAPVATTCGIGACVAAGATACVAGGVVDGCVPLPPAASDVTCNGIDDDCDGLVDEDAPVSTWYWDADGDGRGEGAQFQTSCSHSPGYVPNNTDCNDTDPSIWATPAEATLLTLSHDSITAITTLSWGEPSAPGGLSTSLRYDVIRSSSAADFDSEAVCLASQRVVRVAQDGSTPVPSAVLCYLARATNACPLGTGTLGFRSSGSERVGRLCP